MARLQSALRIHLRAQGTCMRSCSCHQENKATPCLGLTHRASLAMQAQCLVTRTLLARTCLVPTGWLSSNAQLLFHVSERPMKGINPNITTKCDLAGQSTPCCCAVSYATPSSRLYAGSIEQMRHTQEAAFQQCCSLVTAWASLLACMQ